MGKGRLQILYFVYHHGFDFTDGVMLHITQRRMEESVLQPQGFPDQIPVKGDGQPVVVVGWENKGSGMLKPQVLLHISCCGIRQHIAAGGILHPTLPAVIDGKQSAVRYIAAFKPFHMKIVEAEHHPRKYLVGGHGAVAGFVAELPDRAAIALRQ